MLLALALIDVAVAYSEPADDKNCAERQALAPLILTGTVTGFEYGTGDAWLSLRTRVRVDRVYKGAVRSGELLVRHHAQGPPDSKVTLFGALDSEGVFTTQGANCRASLRPDVPVDLEHIVSAHPETAETFPGAAPRVPPTPRPDLADLVATPERVRLALRNEPETIAEVLRYDDGEVTVRIQLDGLRMEDVLPVGKRAPAHLQSLVQPVLVTPFRVGPLTWRPGTPVDEDGCPSSDSVEATGVHLKMGTALSCSGTIGTRWTPTTVRPDHGTGRILKGQEADLRARAVAGARPIATLDAAGIPIFWETGRSTPAWVQVRVETPFVLLEGWLRHGELAPPNTFRTSGWGRSYGSEPCRGLPAGTRVHDETGGVLATADAPAQLMLLASDATRDWVVVPLPTRPLIGIVTWPEGETRPTPRRGECR